MVGCAGVEYGGSVIGVFTDGALNGLIVESAVIGEYCCSARLSSPGITSGRSDGEYILG